MIYKRILGSTILLLGLGFTGLRAQESLNATGAVASGGGGTANYSVGQVVYTTNTGTNGSVAQGVQQSYEISVVTAIEQAKDIHLSASVYPNPTTDYLILSVPDFDTSKLTYQLYDGNGILLQSKNITSANTNIAMSNLLPAVYFVKITLVETMHASSNNNASSNNSALSHKELKSFKIIKK
jgi:hypothetical protein